MRFLDKLEMTKRLKVKIILSVIVADVFHHLAYEVHLAGGELALLDVLAYYVAEDAAEVLVAGI